MVQVDDQGKMVWCPFEYEYLPDFCYVCGIIGHLDKDCSIKLKRGEEPQYGKWMRWIPPKKLNVRDGRKGWQDREGRRGFNFGSAGSGGSDAPNWRKSIDSSKRLGLLSNGSERDISSPLKMLKDGKVGLGLNKINEKSADSVLGADSCGGEKLSGKVENKGGGRGSREGSEFATNNLLVDVEVQVLDDVAGGGVTTQKSVEGKGGDLRRGLGVEKPKLGTFKRRTRGSKGEKGEGIQEKEKKRRAEDMDIDGSVLQKKGKVDVVAAAAEVDIAKKENAGLSK
jgi:hypothetical protein